MRSLLFVPGDQERKLARALAAGADALIVDLEDSVADAHKARARECAAAFLAARAGPPRTPRLLVRINGLASGLWSDDLAAIISAKPDAIVLPKPRSGADVHRLAEALDAAERRAGLASGSTRILAIATEEPASLLAMDTYAGASPRLEGLAWGSEDLSAALGARRSRDARGGLASPFRLARDLTLVAAAAAGVAAIDEVYVDFRDSEGLEREAREAALDGFAGKLALHPDQVPVINAAFTPSADDIARAREIVRLLADGGGSGVASLKGRMIDRPHLKRAERVLERARLAGLEG
jgi:citrate lyase subunit beta/citryl-CoA lyase